MRNYFKALYRRSVTLFRGLPYLYYFFPTLLYSSFIFLVVLNCMTEKFQRNVLRGEDQSKALAQRYYSAFSHYGRRFQGR